MLDRAAALVAPGGVLVYCTCSLFMEEGEAQAPAFLDRREDFAPSPITAADDIPSEFVTADGHLRTRPDQWAERGGLDGFFAARFRRRL